MTALPENLTLAQASRLVHERALSPVALMETCLARIEAQNPKLLAFLHVMADQAMQEAAYADGDLERGEDWGPLHGLPLAVKDLIDVSGEPTTAGSDFFRDRVPENDAPVVTRLKAAGAIIIGKTHLHEFAIGGTTINPHYGAALNPWNPALSPGGSSGGSAAAVAAGMCLAALGTDTGGSVRLPSAFCNLTGLRPGKGQIPTEGVIPLSETLDTVGPMAWTAADLALMLDALENRTVSYTRTLADPVRDLAVAVPEDDFVWRDTHTGIAMAVRGAIDLFEDMGMTIRAASLPGMEAATRAGGLMSIAEGAAYHEERMRSAPERFGGDVRSRLELGLSYSAVDYSRARATGRAWRSEVDGLFRDGADLIALPVTPILPPPVKGTDSASVTRVLLKFTYAFSLSAMPSLSLPCGFTPDGLPVGVQLIAPSTELLLRVAHAYQGLTSWHTRRPDAPDSAKSAADLQNEKDPGNE